jgi:hypothetical protein
MTRTESIRQFAELAFAALLVLPGLVRAQDTATIVGTVQDQTGAAIPGAHVTLVNVAT